MFLLQWGIPLNVPVLENSMLVAVLTNQIHLDYVVAKNEYPRFGRKICQQDGIFWQS